MAEETVITAPAPQVPIVQVVTPRPPRQRVRRAAARVAGGIRRAGAAGRRIAVSAGRSIGRGFRSVGQTVFRRVGGSFAARKRKRAEIRSRVRPGGSALLKIGRATIAILAGAGVAIGLDKLLTKYITPNKGIRLAVNLGISFGVWFLAPWAGPTWGGMLQALSIGHAVTGIIIVGVEAVNQAAASTA